MTVTDADGATGTGYTYTIGTGGSSVVALLRDHLLPRLIGREADQLEAVWHDLMGSTPALTVGPVASLALAAVDTALWDLRCRRAGLPLHRAPAVPNQGPYVHHRRRARCISTLCGDAFAPTERLAESPPSRRYGDTAARHPQC